MNLSAIYPQYYEWTFSRVKIGEIAKRTAETTHYQMTNKILPLMGELELPEIKFQDIERFKYEIPGDLSNRSKNIALIELSKILKYCHEMDWIESIPKIKRFRENLIPIERLSIAQIRMALKCANEKQRRYFQIALYTGMRPNEITHLTWEDIDFEKLTITIRSENRLKRGRTIPIHPELVRILYKLPRTDSISPYSKTEYARKAMSRLSVKVGFKINPYIIRKTALSLLADANVSQSKLQALAGHSSPSTTSRYYIKHEIESLREVIGAIDF